MLLLLLFFSQAFAETEKQECQVAGQKATVWASSELISKKNPGRYAPVNAFDGDSTTAWVEGKEGSGKGESISFSFFEAITVRGLLLIPGYTRNSKTFVENQTPTSIVLEADGKMVGAYEINYDANYYSDQSPHGGTGTLHTDAEVNIRSKRIIVLPSPVSAKSFRVIIEKTLDGSPKYADCAISEIRLLKEHAGMLSGTDSIAYQALLSIAANSRLNSFENARVQDIRSKLLLKEGLVHPQARKATYMYVIRKNAAMSQSVGLDTAHYQKPTNIKRLADSTVHPGKSDTGFFITANQPGFLNTFVTVVNKKDMIFLIGSWTYSYYAETDEAMIAYGFPILALDIRGRLKSAQEQEVSWEEGVDTFLPSPF